MNILVSSGADSQLFVWSFDAWEKQDGFPQLPSERTSSGQPETRVQFHQNQVHFLVVHKTYEIMKLECVKQYVLRESSTSISHAVFSCNSQVAYASFLDGTIGVLSASNLLLRCHINPLAYLPAHVSSLNVQRLVIAAHLQKPNQFAFGLSDVGVHVFKPLQPEYKWGTLPVENCSASKMPSTPSVGASGSDQPHYMISWKQENQVLLHFWLFNPSRQVWYKCQYCSILSHKINFNQPALKFR